jgi:hypothetical protein
MRQRQFAVDRPRWGAQRAATELRCEGWSANDKRIRRVWRHEGLQVRRGPVGRVWSSSASTSVSWA